jgi:uncharacterized protein (TIGR02466 family)
MQLQHLFPVPVGMFDIGRDMTEQEIDFVYSLEKRKNTSNETSVDSYVFNNSALADIYKFAKQSLDAYFELLYAPKDCVSLRITQSWVNYTNNSQRHHQHSHDNSFISGVFYIQSKEESDRIVFKSPTRRELKIPTRAVGDYNSESWWLPAVQGRLILFPSNLVHEVPYFEGEHTRVSLSFNTYPIGILGDELGLTELKI